MKNAEPIKIPIFITQDESYNIFEIKNIEKYDGKIYISEYLKNKYSGPNIEYYETNDPTSINRAWELASFSYNDIKNKIKQNEFKQGCEK